MPNDSPAEPLDQSWLRRLRSRPWVAAIVVLAVVLGGVASFTNSIRDILKLFSGVPMERPVPPQGQTSASGVPRDQPVAQAIDVARIAEDERRRREDEERARQAKAAAEAEAAEARDFAEARGNLDWIFRDAGAARTYQAARDAGRSRYQSALTAQSGRRQQNAYRTIVQYGEQRVERYLQTRGH